MAKKETTRTPVGVVPMRHPEGVGCSFGGRQYEPGAEGIVLVPIEAVSHLLGHGFVPVEGGR